jgi:hypothetical protein
MGEQSGLVIDDLAERRDAAIAKANADYERREEPVKQSNGTGANRMSTTPTNPETAQKNSLYSRRLAEANRAADRRGYQGSVQIARYVEGYMDALEANGVSPIEWRPVSDRMMTSSDGLQMRSVDA